MLRRNAFTLIEQVKSQMVKTYSRIAPSTWPR
jgi:hypothetical protein